MLSQVSRPERFAISADVGGSLFCRVVQLVDRATSAAVVAHVAMLDKRALSSKAADLARALRTTRGAVCVTLRGAA